MSASPLPPKKDVALALLERSTVYVHLDPRADAAIVPPWFKKQPQLVLQVGLNMPVPIPDLRVDDVGLSCTLSFNRSPFHCVVPWACVFALVGDDGRGMVWPEDLPAELARPAPPRPQVVPAPPPGAAEEAAPAKPGKKEKRGKRAAAEAPPDAAATTAHRGPRAVPPPVETEEEARAKKAKKKPRIVPPPPPEARGPLVAVPSPKPPAPRATGRSKKREIPPYLRVVK